MFTKLMAAVASSVFALFSSLLIASCASFGDPLPSTVVDHTFQRYTVRFHTNLGTPQPVRFYLKVFEQDGMLAVCGVSIRTGYGVLDQLADAWLNEAYVTVQNGANKIVSAQFIGQIEESTDKKLANCVKTATPATPELLRNTRPGLVGNEINI